MMSSAVTELESHLQSMLALKPPGVTRSKVNDITRLCSANIQVRDGLPDDRVERLVKMKLWDQVGRRLISRAE